MTTEEKGITPIKIGGGEMVSPDNMGDLFGGTTGTQGDFKDDLSVYKQGKADYWSFGEGDKKDAVLGIFLYSARPLRAFWHPDKDMDGSSPSCHSFGGVTPEAGAESPEAPECQGCPWNALGTAKVGRGKACKAKAMDFIIEVPSNVAINSDGVAEIDKSRLLGPGAMWYSVANKEGPAEFSRFLKGAKEIGPIPYPQAVLGRWGWQTQPSKSGVEYSAIRLEAIAALPSPQDDPVLWAAIASATNDLKQGMALEILNMISGSKS